MGSLFSKRKKRGALETFVDTLLCETPNFAATEAYKLLRTNLTFTRPDEEKKCMIIGISSAVRAEAKSTTAINLSYVIAEEGKSIHTNAQAAHVKVVFRETLNTCGITYV